LRARVNATLLCGPLPVLLRLCMILPPSRLERSNFKAFGSLRLISQLSLSFPPSSPPRPFCVIYLLLSASGSRDPGGGGPPPALVVFLDKYPIDNCPTRDLKGLKFFFFSCYDLLPLIRAIFLPGGFLTRVPQLPLSS